ncbi:MAG: DUF881 domain-containing protein [Armatimonadetes bacterium]|nr:DUF881 domain-containing protein [Armatimonadota bacterium]
MLGRTRAMLSISRLQGAVALFLVAVGFMVVAQMRARQPIRQAGVLPSWRLTELAVLVRQQEDARRQLEAEVEALRRRARDYEAAVIEGRSLSEAMARELARYRLVLGLVPVEGPGVRVVARGGAPGTGGILPSAVEAQDLSGVANELWSAGAEAMAINGIRVLATTSIRLSGGALQVGSTAVVPPYRIEAIGDPAALQAALAIRGGFVEGLRSVGIQVTVQVHERLRIPARGSVEPFRHARPKPAE